MQPRKLQCMKRLSQTESPIFVILCVLCFQRQSCFTFILIRYSKVFRMIYYNVTLRDRNNTRNDRVEVDNGYNILIPIERVTNARYKPTK